MANPTQPSPARPVLAAGRSLGRALLLALLQKLRHAHAMRVKNVRGTVKEDNDEPLEGLPGPPDCAYGETLWERRS